MTSPPSKTNTLSLTSVRQEDGLAVRLHIWLAGVRGWQCYSTLAGMELAVDLGTGPGQSLTVEEEKEGMGRQFLTSQMLSLRYCLTRPPR